MIHAKHKRFSGFTLLEMTVVLVIVGVVAGGAMAMLNQFMERKQLQETQNKMAAIQKAIIDYGRAYNRIPCPANPISGVLDGDFGRESSSGDTAGNTNDAPDYSATTPNTYDCAGPSNVLLSTASAIPGVPQIYMGGVPTKTLDLPDDFAFDGWGRRIMLSVDRTISVPDGLSNVTVDDARTRITIKDNKNSVDSKASNALFALISFGENGHGGYSRAGSATRMSNYTAPTAPDTGDELANCKCTSAAAADAAANATFVQKPSTLGVFDDMLLYGTRADFVVQIRGSYGNVGASSSGLVADASFENAAVNNNSSSTTPSGSGWTFSGSAGVADGKALGNNYEAGNQAGYLNANGLFSQSIFLNNGTYTLRFDAAALAGSQSIELLINGSVVGTVVLTGATPAVYAQQQVTFTITNNGMTTISLRGASSNTGVVFVDNVQLVQGSTATAAPVQMVVGCPADIAGCVLWLDASDGTSINTGLPSSGVGVATWKDKSGNANNFTQGTGGNTPTYVTNAINSLPVLRFDGTNDNISRSALSLTGATWFIVAKPNSTSNMELFSTRSNDSMYRISTANPTVGTGKAGIFRTTRLETYPPTNNPATPPTSGTQLYGGISTSGTYEMFRNGFSAGTTTADFNTGTTWMIGAGQNSSGGAAQFFWNGDVAEVAVYPGALSEADRLTIQAYLANKWGITSQVATDQPTAWYKLDDGSGSTAIDSSVFANTATLAGSGPTWVTGQVGTGAMYFNKTFGLTAPANVGNQLTNRWTMSLWIKQNNTTATGCVLAKHHASTNHTNYNICMDTTTNSIRLTNSEGAAGAATMTPVLIPVDGLDWQHIVFTYDGTSVKGYRNGAQTITPSIQSISFTSSANPLFIGSFPANALANRFQGTIDDVRLYNRALTDSEIATLYNANPVVTNCPASVGGCAMWLDASDTATVNAGTPANNDAVSNWNDKSGYGRHVLATAPNRPLFKTNMINGNPTVSFTDVLQQIATASTSGWGSRYTTFHVVKTTTVTNIARLNSAAHLALEANGHPDFMTFDSATTTGAPDAPTDLYASGRVALLTERRGRSGEVSGLRVDGVPVATKTSTTNLIDGSYSYILGYNSLLDIAEAIYYPLRLSDADVRTIECYLSTKYDLKIQHCIAPCASLTPPTPSCPAGVTGCTKWYRADDISYMRKDDGTAVTTDEDVVRHWCDISGNSNHARTYGTVNYNATGMPGSRPSMRTTNATTTANTGNILSPSTGDRTAGVTRFIAFKSNTILNVQQIVFASRGIVESAYFWHSGLRVISATISGSTLGPRGVYLANMGGVIASRINPATGIMDIFLNGVLIISDSQSRVYYDSAAHIGTGIGIDSNFDYGEYAEYSSPLTDAQIASISSEIGTRWGITTVGGVTACNATNAASCTTGTSAPSAWYKFDEGSGYVAKDSSVNDNNGELINDMTWGAGQIGSSVNINANSEFVSIPAHTGNRLTNAFTISFWMKPTDLSSTNAYLVSKTTADGSSNDYAVLWEYFNNAVTFYAPNNAISFDYSAADTNITISNTNWNHVVYTYDGTTFRGYLNGVAAITPITASFTLPSSTGRLLLGRFTTMNTIGSYNGNLDDVRLYKRALTAEEVSALYADNGSTWAETNSFASCPTSPASGCPYGVSGCRHWLDAQDAATRLSSSYTSVTTNGNPVSIWCDKSPTQSHAIGLGSPTLTTSAINGYPAITMTNLTNNMIASGRGHNAYFANDGEFTFYAVARPTVAVSGPFFGAYQTNIGFWSSYPYATVMNSLCYANSGSLTSCVGSAGLISNNNNYILGGSYNGPSAATKQRLISLNGTVLTNNTDNIASNVWGQLKGGMGVGNVFTGSIGEVLTYDRSLTTAERKNVECGLATKWGITISGCNPVVWYKFDETSGTSAADSSSNANTATLTNGPTWTTGIGGNAVNFDGVDDYVSAPDIAAQRLTNEMTIAFWMKPTDLTSTNRYLLNKHNVGNDGNYAVIWEYFDNKVSFYTSGSFGLASYSQPYSSISVDTADWVHITYTYDGANLRGYKNGVPAFEPIAVTNLLPTATNNAFYIGNVNAASSATFGFKGQMDDVRIYSRALSASEVDTVYRAYLPTASYVGKDTTTKGNWVGTYGADGYIMYGGTDSLPGYISGLTFTNVSHTASVAVFENPSSNVSALWTNPSMTTRSAQTLHSWGTWNYQMDMGSTPRNMSLYMLDMSPGTRAIRIDIYDNVTGSLLDSRTVANDSDYLGGVYHTWRVSGSIKVEVTALSYGTAVSAFFFSTP
jgi:prepilin-type N-terminal cleavage/methylation domain-containing protein